MEMAGALKGWTMGCALEVIDLAQYWNFIKITGYCR
jgi:hypothetical protein